MKTIIVGALVLASCCGLAAGSALAAEAVPAPVLTVALYERFSSRGEAEFADKLLSAMRFQFGGHLEKTPGKQAA